jgi:hypothetical protein
MQLLAAEQSEFLLCSNITSDIKKHRWSSVMKTYLKPLKKTFTVDVEGYKNFLQMICKTNQQV